MSSLTYMQRRKSGTYEFRKRLPEQIAGKPVPRHMREAFGELFNSATGLFKRELVRSLKTKDIKQAKRRDHHEALRATQLFDAACQALTAGPTPRPNKLDLVELERDVKAELFPLQREVHA